MKLFILFPHQLFEDVSPLKNSEVYLVEEYLFFKQYNFHKSKIAFHNATMQYYADYLRQHKIVVNYISAHQAEADIRNLIAYLAKKYKGAAISYYNAVDNYLDRRLNEAAKANNVNVTILESPLFINTNSNLANYFANKKKYFQTDFYIQQRKQLNILIDADGKPEGGKWSFDGDNRLKYPKGKKVPTINLIKANKYSKEATAYTAQYFASNYGEVNTNFPYPTTHQEAKDWLQQFLTQRFSEFGDYEDAIVSMEYILHHSVLTPALNIGLLTPQYIVTITLEYATLNGISLNNTEGFLRQIIGWREFIRGVYVYIGTQERTTNYWQFTRKIPASFYTGTTGIVPVDDVIKKVLATGYCHHIERLMILGNFMLLCEFDPNEVYRWFMELFIDAYDWVMVPNVYGMSQFADGGLMATKPYISGSNYIFKMSDYKKTNLPNGWDVVWDGLFWHFMDKQRKFFLQNPRLGMLIATFDKMDAKKREQHLINAYTFLESL